jgi:hypothetical protein
VSGYFKLWQTLTILTLNVFISHTGCECLLRNCNTDLYLPWILFSNLECAMNLKDLTVQFMYLIKNHF